MHKLSFSERFRIVRARVRNCVFRSSLTNWDVFGMIFLLLIPSGGFWVDFSLVFVWMIWVGIGALLETYLRQLALRQAVKAVRKEFDEAAERAREALRKASSDPK